MDCYIVPTEGSRLNLKVAVTSPTPIDLVIKGFDPDHANSVYFERDIAFFSKSEEFDIPMPISPKKLKVCVFNKNNRSEPIKINYIKAESLPYKQIPFSTKEDMEFYEFIANFSKKAGYVPAGGTIYYSPSKRFEIKYSDVIYNTDGTKSSTPARTFRPNGEIEVSAEKMRKMTVFMIYHILLHERMHIRVDTHDEEKADLYAAKTYTGLGFPKTEALYSFIKVFTPINEVHERALIQRTEKLNNFLRFS